MVFSKKTSSLLFRSNILPRLISIYKASGQYTKMPRTLHKHDDAAELILIREGCGIHIINGKKYYTQKGDLIIINSGILHDESSFGNSGMSIYSCAFTDLKLPNLERNQIISSTTTPVIKSGEYYPELSMIFELIHRGTAEGRNYAAEEASHLLAVLMITVQRLLEDIELSTTSKQNETIKQVKEYIDANYAEEIIINDIAEKFYINVSVLTRNFKNMYGYSPVQYLNRRRIGEAQTLLIDTDKSITDIAFDVGYNDRSYFNKVFVKFMGMSPKKYRELYNKI